MDSERGNLTKELGLRDVFAIATGATLSAGLFLLPGLAAQQAGPAIVLCYLLAAVPLVPAMLCTVELSTAMPRAGGAYYFLERSLGPLFGTVGGLGTWLALVLKTSFALVGLSAYVAIYAQPSPWAVKGIAVGFAVLFGILNVFGAKKTGGFQRKLVYGLLTILAAFLIFGLPEVQPTHFEGFFDAGAESILSTAGLVYISYVGVTKVASVSEEVRSPERNLPIGVFLSLGTALAVYVLCTIVIVGVVPLAELQQSETAMASAALVIGGKTGQAIIVTAACLAFFSVANAGIMASSRYPMAMSRDDLLPRSLAKISRFGTPLLSIALTVGVIIFIVVALDPLKIAKLASAFQLMMFALLCLAVVVMRESGLASYDPSYRTPFFPWLPLFGVGAPFFLIYQMGPLPTLFSLGLVATGVCWYMGYARKHVDRRGAIYHVFARLGEQRQGNLDVELRTILKEKGLRAADPFDEVVISSIVLDLEQALEFDVIISHASGALSMRLQRPAEEFVLGFTEGTLKGATPVAKGVALPHMHLPDLEHPQLVLVRCKEELRVELGDVFGKTSTADHIHAVCFLVSNENNPGQHLRMLAQIATRIDQSDFLPSWLAAENEVQLREVFLRDERHISLRLVKESAGAQLVGLEIRELGLPENSLVAVIRRDGRTLVPRGNTRLLRNDRVLIIGDERAIKALYERYGA